MIKSMNIIGQIIGFAAVGISVFVFQQGTMKRMSAFKLICDILWTLHFLLIGAYTGMVTTTIAILREILLINRKKVPKTDNRIFLFPFCVCFFLAGFITWKNVFSVLPVCASCIATVAFGKKDTAASRKLSLLVSFLMMVYGISVISFSTILNEILTVSSILVSFVRDKKNRAWRNKNVDSI